MSTATPTDPNEAARLARTQRRSQQLLDAAARLMERSGSDAVSMQALAAEAGVSVGLIYRYFGGKNDLLLAVIVNVLEDFTATVPAAVTAAGEDPVEQLAAAFRSYCAVIEDHRHAAILTYRESKGLGEQGRQQIKDLEVSTSEPLREILRSGIEAGVLRDVDVELVAYNLLLLAHAWALKHWYFERTLGFEDYVREQTSLALQSLITPTNRRRYAHLLDA